MFITRLERRWFSKSKSRYIYNAGRLPSGDVLFIVLVTFAAVVVTTVDVVVGDCDVDNVTVAGDEVDCVGLVVVATLDDVEAVLVTDVSV